MKFIKWLLQQLARLFTRRQPRTGQKKEVARLVEDLLKPKKQKKVKPRNRPERRANSPKKKGDLTRKSTHRMRSNDGMLAGKGLSDEAKSRVRTYGCDRKGYR